MVFLKRVTLILSLGIIVGFIAMYLGNKYKILGVDEGNYEKNNLTVSMPQYEGVTENTVFEFVRSYSDGISERGYSLPPEYMEGYTKEELQNVFEGWQMESFSTKKVVFVKNYDYQSPQHYVIKEYEGYVAVFYRKNGVLKELTSTPVASLDEAERKKYEEGVEIDGEKNLVKYLEALES